MKVSESKRELEAKRKGELTRVKALWERRLKVDERMGVGAINSWTKILEDSREWPSALADGLYRSRLTGLLANNFLEVCSERNILKRLNWNQPCEQVPWGTSENSKKKTEK